MQVHKTYKQRLLFSPTQSQQAGAIVGMVRLVYNLGLEQRQLAYSLTRKSLNYETQANELPSLKADFPYLKQAPSQSLQQALKDLHTAYDRFFRGLTSYPTYRKKFLNDSFRCPSPKGFQITRVSRRKGSIKLPKLRRVFFRWTQPIKGRPLFATVTRQAGAWYLAITCAIDTADLTDKSLPSKSARTPIGIDRGCNHTLATSKPLNSSHLLSLPTQKLKYYEEKIAIWQCRLALKSRGSNNYKKIQNKISKIHRKLVNLRHDWHHKLTTKLAKNHSYIFLEDLDIVKMTRSTRGTLDNPGTDVAKKTGLNKSILRQAWGVFDTMLSYKTSWYGSEKHKVNPAYTSWDCSQCHYRHPNNRDGEDFKCLCCGHLEHADINAAKNIETRGRAGLDRLRSKNLRIQEPLVASKQVTTSSTMLAGVPGF